MAKWLKALGQLDSGLTHLLLMYVFEAQAEQLEERFDGGEQVAVAAMALWE